VRLFAPLMLVVLAACGSANATSSSVEIGIEHSRFEPSRIVVRAGESVTFVIRNDDPIAHEFIVGDERVQQVHEEGTEAHHDPRPGEVSIAAGETVTTTYAFDEPGELIFGCHLPGHYAYGMRGTIEIQGP